MTITTKDRLLSELVRASGIRLNETIDEVREKLVAIKAVSRADALRKIAAAFELPEYAVEECL